MKWGCISYPSSDSTGRPLWRQSLALCLVLSGLVGGCTSGSSNSSSTHAVGAETQSVTWSTPTDKLAYQYLENCRKDYVKAQGYMAEFSRSDKTYTTSNLLAAINELDAVLDKQMNLAGLYANVHPNAEMRSAAELCEQNMVSLISEISLSRPLYNRISALNIAGLDAEDRRFVEHMLRDYRRSGVDKDDISRARIKALNEEINLIGQQFDKNIREGGRQLVLDSVTELKGLPQDYIDAHKPNEQGKVILTTAYPDYFPFMQFAENDALRQKFYVIFRQQAYPENKTVLAQLLAKRYELAQLLGYKNFSEYITEDKMIKTPANAQSFIDKVSAMANPRAAVEYQELLTRLKKIDPSATSVADWQKLYLEHLVKKEKYEVNSQEVRQYFTYDNVQKGIFDLTETMFGVTIRPWTTSVWHDSVSAYEVLDKGKVIGRFYLDMHPRDGKYQHAAQFSIVSGLSGVQLPEAALVCNFPAGLMEHSDVETFLHEFGHLMHDLFAGVDQRWVYFSGVKTELDFVEAPSQMLEEWVWDAETLASFARNAKGEVIPPGLVKKMVKARDFGKAMWTKHQLFYAALSLGFYNQDPSTLDLDKKMAEIQGSYSPFGYVDDTYFYTSFGHLNGYSSLYYTYMWSLVIAADMHSEFEKYGLRNSKLAQHYRDTVLAPGGKKDAAELVEDFLGRPYGFDAFSKDLSAP
ncbi:tetraacyldisaccharide 4'-kinase [Cellvibrio sp. KY-GH-1]|uniref:M3 family metallopeptidase n=1 Tax=Cellvibrio sp. KY-GH-1 TaxID=2303332 RepID=UPI0012467977|nr:M3 family metallopeptidase [Cellvibrio sp. KY-GH-1]QEY15168.1 tetraacyldisaccharide 4'-kinase [Cellvibrio sp. KY-GH-1]